MATKKPAKSAPAKSLTALASKLAVRTGAPKHPLVAAMKAASAKSTADSKAAPRPPFSPGGVEGRTAPSAKSNPATARIAQALSTAPKVSPLSESKSSDSARAAAVSVRAAALSARAAAVSARAAAVSARPAAVPTLSPSGVDGRTRPAAVSVRPQVPQRPVAVSARPVVPPRPAPVVARPAPVAAPRSAAASVTTSRASEAPRTQPVGDPRRKYPRAAVNVRASLKLADDPTRFFEATLETSNVSVGGLFLESSYFLKLGTKLDVALDLGGEQRRVHVRAVVVRVETPATGPSGFALRFTEYLDGSEVVLATHFLSARLTDFLNEYQGKHGLDVSEKVRAQMIEVLAAWELRQAETGVDVWSE